MQSRILLRSARETKPEVVAASLFEKLPGSTPAAKSSTALITASIAAYLISKEIYIVDAEFLEMLCLFGAYGVWYAGVKDTATAYFEGRKAQIKKVLYQAREDHKAVVKERMDHIGKLSDVVEVTDALYDISKEIAKLEAEAFELKQKVAFKNEVKSTLENWVRQEAAVREAEQSLLVAKVIEGVKAKLNDPKVQQSILDQSITDIGKLSLSK
ncbi:atp4 subunit B of the stator stalk of mitochondrial F1F0 ATP synthase [Terramyces sp. JEL0728]|nr:atp4 subunit B of the stator stalk of mitochondrial F1F0 ATP synthase [Terramyces sp. JEL0728]